MPEKKRSGTRRRTVVAIAASLGIAALAVTSVNYASASSSVPKSAPPVQDAAAPLGGDGQTNYSYRNDNDGRIHVNERTYSAESGVCTAVISSPATSFNVRNDSDRTVEFFSGITCDTGAPIATIGPRNSSSAIPGTTVFDGAVVPFALVGSFRAVDKRH